MGTGGPGGPAALHAQAVLGFGDDATTLPAGTVRAGFENHWLRYEQRFAAPSGASILTRSQVRRTPVFLELGLLDRLAIRVMVPSVGTQVIATYFPDSARAIHADSQITFPMSGVGDVEVSTKLVWLRTISDTARFHPRGIALRSAVTALARLGTGLPPHSYAQFGIGTGDGQTDLEVASQWDLLVGPRLWTSVVGRYGRQLRDTRVIRVAPPNDPFSTDAGPVVVTRRLGAYYELEATPRLSLGPYVSLGVQYRYRHEAPGTFAGTKDSVTPTGRPIHLDASILNAGSELTEQRIAFGVVYSSVAAYARRQGQYAFEVSFQYLRTLRISGARPRPSEYVVGARVYVPLWGKGFRRPR
jgi:hypothetical protein